MMTRLLMLLFLVSGATLAYSLDASSTSPATHMVVKQDVIEVVWNGQHNLVQPLTFTAADVTIRYGSNGTSRKIDKYIDENGIVLLGGDPSAMSFSLRLDPDITPPASEESFTITIANVRFQGSPSLSSPLTASGTIYKRGNIDALVKATQSALAVTKTTQEKDLFAGLNITIPSSSAGSSDGGVSGDLAYNYSVTSVPKRLQSSSLYDSGNVGIHINKGSTTLSDPRHFDLGLSARKTVLFISSKDLSTIADGFANRSQSAIPSASVIDALNRAQNHFLKAAIIDYGFQMEADVSSQGIGNVSNAIFDIRPQIATGAQAFADGKGYFSVRFMPLGSELGHNIAKPTSSAGNVGGVIRLKSAVDINLLYRNPSENTLIQSVSLTSSTLYRHLFESETAYDPSTKTTSSTVIGNRFWDQTSLSIFSSRTYGKVRPGVNVSYQDGSLPPVFAKVHKFTYGIVFESVDSSQ